MSLVALQKDQMILYPVTHLAAITQLISLSSELRLFSWPETIVVFHVVLRCCPKREMMTSMQMAYLHQVQRIPK